MLPLNRNNITILTHDFFNYNLEQAKHIFIHTLSGIFKICDTIKFLKIYFKNLLISAVIKYISLGKESIRYIDI